MKAYVTWLCLAIALAVTGQTSPNNTTPINKDHKWASDSWSIFITDNVFCGYRDSNGQTVLPAIYDEALDFQNGRALVLSGDEWMVIDETGKRLSNNSFSDVRGFHGDIAVVYVGTGADRRCGYIDRDGQYIVEPNYKGQGSRYTDNLLVIHGRPKTWIFNSKGDLLETFMGYGGRSDGLIAVVPEDSGGRWGYVDLNLELVIEPQFFKAGRFSNGYAPVVTAHEVAKWGYIDREGKIVIKPQYEAADNFSEGLAAVVRGNKLGYINKNNDVVIPLNYSGGSNFLNGKAVVKLSGDTGWTWINKQGQNTSEASSLEDALKGYSAIHEDWFVHLTPGGYGN